MKTFEYVIKDAQGIHARPAGVIAKAAKQYESTVTIVKDGKRAMATRLMAVMGLCVKQGQTIQIEVEGADEAQAAEEIKKLFEENL